MSPTVVATVKVSLYDLPWLVKHGQSAFRIRLQNPRARLFQPAMVSPPFNLLPAHTHTRTHVYICICTCVRVLAIYIYVYI